MGSVMNGVHWERRRQGTAYTGNGVDSPTVLKLLRVFLLSFVSLGGNSFNIYPPFTKFSSSFASSRVQAVSFSLLIRHLSSQRRSSTCACFYQMEPALQQHPPGFRSSLLSWIIT